MNVRTRLRGAFALYIALLTVLSLYHVRTTRRAVASGRALTEIASRLRATSTIQLGRVTQANNDAQKYGVTRDAGYLEKLGETMSAYDGELHRIGSLPLTVGERAQLTPLLAQWAEAQRAADRLRRASNEATGASVAALQGTLDRVESGTQALGAASQEAMARELDESERSEHSAEHATVLAAGGAVLLSILLSALLARSILDPLARLTTGTREVSAGHFDHRLEAGGTDELAQVAREFNSMTERLDELDRMKRDFVSKISHDLKTPLSSMQETTGALLDNVAGPITAQQRRLLAINHESGQRLLSMLTKLLDLSRIEAGLEPALQVLDVREVLRRSVERITTGADARISVEMSDPASHLLVRGNPDSLGQVIDNLLDNAMKFSAAGGEIRVELRDLATRGDRVPAARWAGLRRQGTVRGAVLITVADEGPGIPDDEKDRVFTRFYQTETGRAVRGRGVGLGLAICQEIVSAHGGVMWVADNQPRGSTFLLLLPGAVRGSAETPQPAITVASERPA